jgi:superfamily II DNA or RNA helicase
LLAVDCQLSIATKQTEKIMPEESSAQYSMPNIRLHRWQEDCLAKWFENGSRGIVRVATGAGKTLLALAAARHLAARDKSAPLKVKIVVPKVFLAAQWRADVMEFLGVPRKDVGLFFGAIKETEDKPFMIYVLNTARLCVSRHILKDANAGSSVFLICDECHRFGSAENAHVFDFLPHIPRERYFALGLSATPDGKNYDEILIPAIGKEIYRYELPDATRDRIVADCAFFHIEVDFTPEEKADYDELSGKIASVLRKLLRRLPSLKTAASNGAFFQKLLQLQTRKDDVGAMARALTTLYHRRKEIVHKARMRIVCGMEIVRRLMPDHRTILFTERIETADILLERLRKEFPGQIDRYHSLMDAEEKARALSRYKTGESKVIVCCRALDEGLNVPETDAGIILSVGSGIRQRIQRVGRVLRRGNAERLKKIYYLHISGGVEEAELLFSEYPVRDEPNLGIGGAAYRLRCAETGNLSPDPVYRGLADRVMAYLELQGASERHLRSAERQLEKGAVRTDFLLAETECAERRKRTRGDERDYWAAMLLMARMRAEAPR